MTGTIGFDDFMKVEIRAGRVLRAEPFPEARKPAIKLWIDFGPEIGERKSSAQITAHYAPEDLVGTMVMAVTNFPPRQIGPFMSEVLVLGVHDAAGNVTLVRPDHDAPLGARMCCAGARETRSPAARLLPLDLPGPAGDGPGPGDDGRHRPAAAQP